MIDRRTILLGTLPLCLPQRAMAQRGLLTTRHQQAVDNGLQCLAQAQSDQGDFGNGEYERNLAVVSLAGLAFLANGNVPDRGPNGKTVSLIVDYVLRHAQPTGVIRSTVKGERGPMYGHGFASLFLAQVLGVSRQVGLRKVLEDAVKLIVTTQNEAGGWRYEPQKGDADISVTGVSGFGTAGRKKCRTVCTSGNDRVVSQLCDFPAKPGWWISIYLRGR